MNSYDRARFLMWYAQQAARHKLDLDPDNPLHFYDWQTAWQRGARADASGHWPSEYKLIGHPNLIIDGIDTRTGRPASPDLMRQNRVAGILPYLKGYR